MPTEPLGLARAWRRWRKVPCAEMPHVRPAGKTFRAIYKTMFDARGKLRAALAANGISMPRDFEALMNGWSALDASCGPIPAMWDASRPLRCSLSTSSWWPSTPRAEQRYPGIAAHFRSCGPCGEDFEGLLAASRDARTDCHTLLPAPVARPQSFLLGPSLG